MRGFLETLAATLIVAMAFVFALVMTVLCLAPSVLILLLCASLMGWL